MINVSVGGFFVGALDRAREQRYAFSYLPGIHARDAVSLTMRPQLASYPSAQGHLHPIFDMNLPEGFLRNWLSKAVSDFDDLALLRITGSSQIGRLQYDSGEGSLPVVSVPEILTYDGSEDLFQYLLHRYAVASGISGVQPKVLVRDIESHKISKDHKVTVAGATHIVKTWDEKYPQLALNEHFGLCAAKYSGLSVPEWSLSLNGRFLIIDRFDIDDGHYFGVEDFCVLAGMTSNQKYQGSYEQLARTLRLFVEPGSLVSAQRDFFKMVALSCTVRNGDAHRKNFCLLYNSAEARVGRLSPTFDIVTTTAYIPVDSMALTMEKSKAWPGRDKLLRFASTCGLLPEEAKRCLDDVEAGVSLAREELRAATLNIPEFKVVGSAIGKGWEAGLKNLSPTPRISSKM